MIKAFTFDPVKCTGCNACSASCLLENGWNVKVRNIYSWNNEVFSGLPVINFSLACNHCESPACLKSCPAGCYTRDESSGAILINQTHCLGCSYCQWNCPYDAPKMDSSKHVIEKCNLCYTSLSDGEKPACANACPTGALNYGNYDGENINPEWFPVKNLNPSIVFRSKTVKKFRTVPEEKFQGITSVTTGKDRSKGEMSLVLFSFLAAISVSFVAVSMLKGTYPGLPVVLSLCLATGIASFFHLGKPLRAWMSLINLKKSPLSREILLFLIFSGLSIAAALLKMPALLAGASITGLLMLLAIDSVYILPDRSAWLHSGQTLITSLLFISYLSASILPFTFIVFVKIIMAARLFIIKRKDIYSGIRYIRLAVLLLAWAGWISGFNQPGIVTVAFVILSEFVDRFLFYADFEPENIRTQIINNLNRYVNEEKRG